MSVELAREIWNEVRGLLTTTDRADAADHIVSILIDHDITCDEIKDAFKNDTDFKNAIKNHRDGHEEEYDEDWDDEDDYEDD